MLSVAAQAADLTPPLVFSAEGSFPLQYTQTVTGTSRQSTFQSLPYLAGAATLHLQPDVSASLFVDAGHDELGSFRDNDNTFTSFGGNVVKRWGAFSAGTSIEHTHYYDGVFGDTANVVNDVNLFARYTWLPNPDWRIVPGATVTARFDDDLAFQRSTYTVRAEIERRLSGPWWAVAQPRLRYAVYAGSEAGRRDVTASLVGGVKYEFNESVSARVLVGYENRSSNLDAKNFDKFVAGVSLDYKFNLERPRW
jgi:hypothetical protein